MRYYRFALLVDPMGGQAMKTIKHFCCATVAIFGIASLQAAEPETITNSLEMKLVLIPSGEFRMGAEEDPTDTLKAFPYAQRRWLEGELPEHTVRIKKPFYMGAYEVTIQEFLSFSDAAKYKTDAERDVKPSWGYDAKGKLIESPTFRPSRPGWEQSKDEPVTYISWNDAVAFCKWLSQKEGKKYRLPTEAEWEYACRAGSRTRFWNGNKPEDLVSIGNVADTDLKSRWPNAVIEGNDKNGRVATISFPFLSQKDAYAFAAPVGKFKPNPFGLYDMHGNVWEWCQDWYDKGYYAKSPADDPQGPPAGSMRAIRGGGWNLTPVDARSAFRVGRPPTFRFSSIGFRFVCDRE